MYNEKINDIEVSFKKKYLTNSEVNFLIVNAIESYMQSKDIKNYGFSPLSAFYNFYAVLFYDCIEGYDIDSKDDFNKMYNNGVHVFILDNILNAKEAYNIFISTMKQVGTLEGVLQTGIQKISNIIMDRMPEKEELKEVIEKLPEEWRTVADEYSSITGAPKKEDGVINQG